MNFRVIFTIFTSFRVHFSHTVTFSSVHSTDSGWDNPFQPDGDLSKEADEIVELIREGKPITPTQHNPSSKLLHDDHDGNATLKDKQNLTGSPKGAKANGNAKLENSVVTGVEVQHGTIATPTDGSQVEHVVIKKKPKCKCCSIQ